MKWQDPIDDVIVLYIIPGSSKCVKFVRFHQKNPTKRQKHFTYLEDPGILNVSKNRGTPKWMVYNGKPY